VDEDTTVNGTLNYTGGTLDGTAGKILTNNGTINVDADLAFDNITIANAGTINVSALLDGNTASGVFTNTTGTIVAKGAAAELDVDFTNEGIISVPSAAGIPYNTLTITGDIINTPTAPNPGHIDIGLNGTLVVSGSIVNNTGGTIAIAPSGKLDATGTFTHTDGTINIAQGGTFDATGGTFTHTAGTINVNGAYIPDNGAIGGGIVNVGAAGTATYTAATADVLTGTGTINVASGGKLEVNSGGIKFIGDDTSIFDLTGVGGGGSISYVPSTAVITVSGAVKLAAAYTLPAAQKVNVLAGGTLFINAALTFGATGAPVKTALTGTVAGGGLGASQLITGTGGTVTFATLATESNFFYPAATAVQGTAGKTYTWSATAGGTTPADVPGWLGDS
jgi:hypothetical protein